MNFKRFLPAHFSSLCLSVFQHTYCFSQFDIIPSHTLTKNKLCPIIQVISNEWCLPSNQSLVGLCISEPDDPAGFLPNLSTPPVHTTPLCRAWEAVGRKNKNTGNREERGHCPCQSLYNGCRRANPAVLKKHSKLLK